ncbi:MAG: hypothetical protein ABUL48_06850, partial [Pseudorhodoplanes sp.]
MVRLSGRPIALAFAALLAACAASAPALADGVAFAKASPLLVYDSASFENGKSFTFQFGVAYPVIERTGDAVEIRLVDGTTGYLKAAHVVVEDRARYVVSSPGFQSKDRPALRFWQSQSDLNDFLGSADATQPTDDYRELIGEAPDFAIKLPVFNVDMSDSEVLGSQVPMAEVLLPIPRAAYQKFEEVKGQGGTGLELYFVLDASGSTDGFLQPALADIAAALKENATVAGKIGKVSVTLFGANLKDGAEKVGTIDIADLASDKWYPADY